MPTASYIERRGELLAYFDRTAVEAWTRLTSDAPVGRIRATVRAGRDHMRSTLLSWLPDDMRGARLLDAGCGTGALAIEAAKRGAYVVAVDLSPTLVGLARQRKPADLRPGAVEFLAGDMLAASHGRFDYVVAMDSLIHYRAPDIVDAVAGLAARTSEALLFTFAPRTPALALMHAVGRVFPKGDRAPAIEPIAALRVSGMIAEDRRLAAWRPARDHRVTAGFYISHALELRRA